MEEAGQRLREGIMSGKDTAALVRIKRIEERILVVRGTILLLQPQLQWRHPGLVD